MKKNVRVAAREAMQKFCYDPLDELVKYAQSSETSKESKLRVAEILLPYMYPKLSSMTVEADVHDSRPAATHSALFQKILSDPTLADAAQRLSVAASMVALEAEDGRDQTVQ